jgi:magnesium transporter
MIDARPGCANSVGEVLVPTTPKLSPDDAVTLHMHQDHTTLRAQQTVGEALAWLRQHPPTGRIIYFYVLDGDQRLRGIVPTRRLLLSPPEASLADIMVAKVITIPAGATVLDACEFFIQHRLLAFPVVDDDGRMLGVVDIQLYTDEVEQLSDANVRDDLFQLIGVHAARGRSESPLSAFGQRFPWLGCNLAAGILAAFLTGLFQQELDRAVALAYFIPVVLNMAESVSSQSVSLALQMLHGQRPTWQGMAARLRGEFGTGLMLGLASGAVVALVALVWLGQTTVALCLVGGITGGVAGAAVLGLALPMMLRLFHLEPRVAAGPIALAGADILTIVLYLTLARWLLG